MVLNVKLRRAKIDDCDMLLAWRNDDLTRAASHSADPVERDAHVKWLESILCNPMAKLFIAELDSKPVGSVRAYLEGGRTELSWTVAPLARGQGVAKAMVKLVCDSTPGQIRAEVKKGNMASVNVAVHVGMKLVGEESGVLYFMSPY